MGNGTFVLEGNQLYGEHLAAGKWHRSIDRKDTAYGPFGSYMMNKKWTLEEEFNNHLMKFLQVTVSSIYFRKLDV